MSRLMKKTIFIFVLIYFNPSLYANTVEEFLYYELKPGQFISEVLSDLGTCPLYGEDGHLKRVLDINKNINPDKIEPGQKLKIPVSFINDFSEVLIFPNSKILPKSINNNLCSRKKTTNLQKIINLPNLKEEIVYISDNTSSDVKLESSLKQKKARKVEEPYDEEAPPKVLNFKMPFKRSYKKNETLTFSIQYDRPIFVDGTPSLNFKVDGKNKKAKYSKVEKKEIIFKHKLSRDLDLMSILEIAPSIDFANGTIYSNEGVQAEEKLSLENTL